MVQMIEAALAADASIYEAVRAIEETVRRLAVVTTPEGKLLGTLTDGDIRRCFLAGGTMESRVCEAMTRNPVSAPVNTSSQFLIDLLHRNNIRALPLVDDNGLYVRIIHLSELLEQPEAGELEKDFSAAVIMAGGEGTRLRPLTEDIPKPMVEIGGLPLLERQLQRLVEAGIQLVYISVNYLSHIIEDHFLDGERYGVPIKYLREKDKLGTAGALSLIPDKLDGPLLVMNGDVFTTSDFVNLSHYHTDQQADLSVSAIEYNIKIPYGVIRSENARIIALEEKPSQRFLCNAGIYVLSPHLLSMIPSGSFFNMTDLIKECLATGKKVVVFPVHEYWSDIGTPADLAQVRQDFIKMSGEK